MGTHKSDAGKGAPSKVKRTQTGAQKRAESSRRQFLAECVAMEAESANQAGALGYMARVLVQATLPHSARPGTEYSRSNGSLHVSIMSPAGVGLPYGSYPRLLLAWLTTEAVRTKSSTLYLGETLSGFMAKLGLLPTGGRWGTIPRLRDQVTRLFTSYVTAYEAAEVAGVRGHHHRGSNLLVAEDFETWWDPRDPGDQASLFQSWVKLSDKFYQQIVDRPVPVDLRAIRALKKSPLALDLYSWTSYRMSYLNHRTEIPWDALQMQFGSDYGDDDVGRRNFRRKVLDALRKVLAVYPALHASPGDKGLLLLPSPPHVSRLR